MFTGIVEELGTVAARDGSRLRIRASAVLDGVGWATPPRSTDVVSPWWLLDTEAGWWEADVTEESYARHQPGCAARPVPG